MNTHKNSNINGTLNVQNLKAESISAGLINNTALSLLNTNTYFHSNIVFDTRYTQPAETLCYGNGILWILRSHSTSTFYILAHLVSNLLLNINEPVYVLGGNGLGFGTHLEFAGGKFYAITDTMIFESSNGTSIDSTYSRSNMLLPTISGSAGYPGYTDYTRVRRKIFEFFNGYYYLLHTGSGTTNIYCSRTEDFVTWTTMTMRSLTSLPFTYPVSLCASNFALAFSYGASISGFNYYFYYPITATGTAFTDVSRTGYIFRDTYYDSASNNLFYAYTTSTAVGLMSLTNYLGAGDLVLFTKASGDTGLVRCGAIGYNTMLIDTYRTGTGITYPHAYKRVHDHVVNEFGYRPYDNGSTNYYASKIVFCENCFIDNYGNIFPVFGSFNV